MSTLSSVVYVSTASREFDELELEGLLQDARRLNLQTQTTGVLLYSGGNFMQCFEGPDESIDLTYGRIRSSRRHHSLIELAHDEVGQRSFGGFDMAYKTASRSELLKLSTANWRNIAQDDAVDPPSGLFLLRQFWDRSRA